MLSENLARKFGIKPGASVLLCSPPRNIPEDLRNCLPGAVQIHLERPDMPLDLVLWWPASLKDLPTRLSALTEVIHPAGAVWLMMPKKKFAPARGILFTWDELQQAALQTDFVDNKVASFSETDYGTRFVIRKDRRR